MKKFDFNIVNNVYYIDRVYIIHNIKVLGGRG